MDIEKFTKAELAEHIASLNTEIEGLRRELDESTWLEGSLKRRTQLLNERVKELQCAFGIVTLVRSPHMAVEGKLTAAMMMLPQAWLHPGAARARIIANGKTYESPGFKETEWMLSEPVIVRKRKVGQVDMAYTRKQPDVGGGPFLPEERTLLSVAAECIGLILEQHS